MSQIRAFFFPPLAPGRYSIPLFLLRLVAGAAFMYHGWSKIQSPFTWMGPDSGTPALFQALAALSEFGGGLAWILGLLTPLASAGLLATMIVAVWKHAIVRGDPFVGRGGSYEIALLYAAIAIVLTVCGPGRLSLDALITKTQTRSPE